MEKCHLRHAVFRDRLEEVFLLLNICVQCANFSISSSLISKYLDKLLPPFSCKWECLNLLAVKLPLLPSWVPHPPTPTPYVEISPYSSRHIFFSKAPRFTSQTLRIGIRIISLLLRWWFINDWQHFLSSHIDCQYLRVCYKICPPSISFDCNHWTPNIEHSTRFFTITVWASNIENGHRSHD